MTVGGGGNTAGNQGGWQKAMWRAEGCAPATHRLISRSLRSNSRSRLLRTRIAWRSDMAPSPPTLLRLLLTLLRLLQFSRRVARPFIFGRSPAHAHSASAGALW